MNFWKVADLWYTLMTQSLGYGRTAPRAATLAHAIVNAAFGGVSPALSSHPAAGVGVAPSHRWSPLGYPP